MKLKLLRIMFALFSVLVIVALTASMTASAAATTKSLSTNFTLMNLSPDKEASVTVDYIKPDGTSWSGSSYTQTTIPANGGQWIVRQYDDKNLTAGKGSVVISSSQRLGALVQLLNKSSGAPTSGAYTGIETGTSKAYVPLVARNAASATGKVNSQIMVQNLGTSAANVTISFFQGSATPVATRNNPNLAVGATWYYDASDDTGSPALGTGWYSAAVEAASGGQIAVISNLFFGADGLMTFNAFPVEKVDSKWYIPLLYSKLSNTLNTSLVVQNLDTTGSIAANDLTLSCTKDTSPSVPGPATLSIKNADPVAVNASYYFNTFTDSRFPSGWYGSCNVSSASGKKMVVMIQYRYINSADQDAYQAVPASSTDKTVFIPLVGKRLSNNFATTVTVQNLSESATANITITYTASGGSQIVRKTTIAPGSSLVKNYRLASTEAPEMADGWVGTMKVTSDTPIQAYVANTNLVTNGDQYQTYLGFTQP